MAAGGYRPNGRILVGFDQAVETMGGRMTLRAQNVLLTGASGSIGAEAARQLAARGARLALSGRREERLAALAREPEAAGGEAPAVAPAALGRRGRAPR